MKLQHAFLLLSAILGWNLPLIAQTPARPPATASPLLQVGVAKIDITPDFPVRLHGFGGRRAESEGVTQRIWAKALAFADPQLGPAVLITTDNLGVPDVMVQDLAKRLGARAGLKPDRLTVTATHTHTAPMLTQVAPTLFGMPVPPEHELHIDQYTAQFARALETVALAAISNIQPSRVSWGIGKADFARNRRTPGGPVDHDLPTLTVSAPDGTIRAIYTSYACHCVTLSHNKISGDWAGYAQESLERTFPQAIALISVGCGADSNPDSGVTGDNFAVCAAQGQKITESIVQLMKTSLEPIHVGPTARTSRITLPLAEARTMDEWRERAKRADAVGHHARVNLARLAQGTPLVSSINYPLQTWTFGEDLTMVFLPGEVVVDYGLRLKRELDRSRLWVNAYANDAPCYIPSERILKEGGYEGGDAMVYYDVPQRFAPGLESKIVEGVKQLVPESFHAMAGTEGTRPRTPEEALRLFQLPEGLEIELVASEPLISDPVAIDWDAHGRLWVVEMHDYPTGLDGQWKPGGRLRVLEDRDGDGRYDHSLLLSSDLPFPTGVMAWGNGALVCAAPEILHFKDDNRDGVADAISSLMKGFAADNYQARVNGLSLGLDGWIHAANGLLGGNITIQKPHSQLDIRGHDFRFTRDFKTLETVSGLSQQGRVRDDWGNWFGCDNSTSLRQYPMEQRHLARNPHVTQNLTSHYVPNYSESSHIYPISRLMDRFNDPDQANRITSGCGLGLYRDRFLGDAYHGNAFICEPTHNLVHREVISMHGILASSQRAPTEKTSEFLASKDAWFRPVQARTGPDGALYIVDMYRFLIEHPRWISPERVAQLNVRAGSDQGRIYRIKPAGAIVPRIRSIATLNTRELVRAMDHPNGTERDRVHLECLRREDLASARNEIQTLATQAGLAEVRVQAYSLWTSLQSTLSVRDFLSALQDPHPNVRRFILQCLETEWQKTKAIDPSLLNAIRHSANESDPTVRFQAMLALGWDPNPSSETVGVLASLSAQALTDPWWKAGWLSSITHHAASLLVELRKQPVSEASRNELITALIATALGNGTPRSELLKAALASPQSQSSEPASTTSEQLAILASALPTDPSGWFDAASLENGLRSPILQILSSPSLRSAPFHPKDTSTAARIALMARLPEFATNDLSLLMSLLREQPEPGIQDAIWKRLQSMRLPETANALCEAWNGFTPSLRSKALTLMLSRDSWTLKLLQACAQGKVSSSEISLADRQRMLQHSHQEIRESAARLFDSKPDVQSSNDAEYLAAVRTKGNPDSGRALFLQHCSTCHRWGNDGYEVGPDLALLRSREPDFWIQNILRPNAVIEPRYVPYEVVLKDDRTLTGIVTSETPSSMTLVQAGGAREAILRTDIQSMRALKLSLMPEGFGALLTPERMADLLSFMRSGKGVKTLVIHRPEVIKPQENGIFMLPASAAHIQGGSIAFEPPFGNVGMWHGTQDQVFWDLEVSKTGEYDVHLDWACAPDSAGNRFALHVAGQKLIVPITSTGAWSDYRQTRIGLLRLEAGKQKLRILPEGTLKSALMDLRTVALVPKGQTISWNRKVLAVTNDLPPDGVPRTAAAWARLILDPAQPVSGRETALAANPQFGADLIMEMTGDLRPGTPTEYERIPWIWRVAIAAGKRNDPYQIARILEVSLPRENEPLRDWQAVVMGGGIINGLSQRNLWPAQRLNEVLDQTQKDPALLKARLHQVLKLSLAMADDPKVPSGTRYDALRILGIGSWKDSGEVLLRYLKVRDQDELQMGAVSGLGDIAETAARNVLAQTLASGELSPDNRKLASAALERPLP